MSADVEFIEDSHTYLLDGVLVPSVSEIIAWHSGDQYSQVPAHILLKAQVYGTRVHEAIEKYVKTLEADDYAEEVGKYAELEERYNIVIESSEQIITYGDKYAGRYDMIGTVNGDPALLDIKTTYRINKEHLALQLGLYRMALQKPLKCFCVWIPKRAKGKLVEIEPTPEEELKKIVEAYWDSQSSATRGGATSAGTPTD